MRLDTLVEHRLILGIFTFTFSVECQTLNPLTSGPGNNQSTHAELEYLQKKTLHSVKVGVAYSFDSEMRG